MKTVVYHGTTLSRFHQIMKDKTIKVTSAENKRYHDTTEGFVYVTKNLCDALDFSTKPEKGEDTLVFCVFRIIIDESELINDSDEQKWCSTLTDDGEQYCYKISRDLLFGDDVEAVYAHEIKSYNEQGNFMQAVQYGDITIDESRWHKCQP